MFFFNKNLTKTQTLFGLQNFPKREIFLKIFDANCNGYFDSVD